MLNETPKPWRELTESEREPYRKRAEYLVQKHFYAADQDVEQLAQYMYKRNPNLFEPTGKFRLGDKTY